MTGFDYIVFVVVAVAAVTGFFRGFVEEVLALAAWCLALLAVHTFHALLTDVLTAYVHSQTGAGIIAFALLLAVPYFATKWLAGSLGRASRGSTLGPFDRVLGFGFGAIKGFVLMVLAFSLLVFAYDVVWGPKGRPDWIRKGRTYPFLNAASEELMTMLAARREAAIGAARDSATDAAIDAATQAASPAAHHHRRRHAQPESDQ